MTHPCCRVQEALVQLNDALCSWERSTGKQSVLIVREEGGWFHRSQSGKPLPSTSDDIPDCALLDQIAEHHK